MAIADIFKEYRALLRLGLPVLVTNLSQIAVAFADTMMVGTHSTAELAAAAFVNNFFMVPVVMLIGFAAGVTPLVGLYYGRRDHYAAGRMIRVAMQLNLAAGLVSTAVMGALYFGLDSFGQPPELMPLIKPYYLVVMASLVATSLFNALQQVANGTTDTAMPMWVMIGANVANIAGNYLLIFGHCGLPEMGLMGAGASTVTARWGAAIVIALIILRGRSYRPYRPGLADRRPLGELRRELFGTSWPVMVQSGIETVLWALGAIVCGWFGALQLAGYQVVVTISQLGFMTYLSFGVAVSIRVANCMGCRDFTNLRRSVTAAFHLNLALCAAASLVFIFGTGWMLRFFTADAAVKAVALALVPPLVLYQLADAMQVTYANSLRGTGHVTPLFWISIVAYLIVGIPSLLFMATTLGMQSIGVYYSFSAALFTAALLYRVAYRRAVARAEKGEDVLS